MPIVQTMPDCTKVGGLTESWRIAWMAYERNIQWVPHGWNTAIGLAADLHLSAAMPVARYVEPVSASEQTEIQQFFERLWAEQRSKGHIPRTREEIDAERVTAHQEDEERMRELERIHEEGQRHRQQQAPSSKP